MTHLGILKKQKNEIFTILENAGFNLNDFSMTELNDSTYIQYKDKRYYCSITVTNNVYHNKIDVAPGDKILNQSYHPKNDSWNEYLTFIQLWIDNLKEETSTVDKWKELKDHAGKIILIDFITGEDFKDGEKHIIRERIKLIQKNLGTLGLETEELKSIENKLDDLSGKLDTLNKTNWFELFIGAIIGKIISLSIPQSTADQIWEIIKMAFNNFIQIST
ncbi:MAG: hypothetical protein KAI99_03980 [Cyclobacteriaceae bacterium]|nr:hypothetical protein [Cyclobacteriaceae bacterium]